MKLKTGKCVDCGPDAAAVPVTAGRCNKHYWPHRQRVNAAKPAKKKIKADKAVVGAFLASQTLVKPERCEECGVVLPLYPQWMVLACIAHILKKRTDHGFPSVAIHPMNKIFLCPDCHTNMDCLGDVFILKMKTLPVMRERVQVLLPFLTTRELSRVPGYFLQS